MSEAVSGGHRESDWPNHLPPLPRNRFQRSGHHEPFEMKDTKECVIYRIDMPGCPTSELVYWVHGNELHVFAEEPAMPEYNHGGRKYGGSMAFETEFYDVKKAIVNLVNGVLWIIVPKVQLPGKIIKANASYFIDDKGLIGMVCIYIVRADTFKKIPIDALLDPWPCHLAYVPSLVSNQQKFLLG
ncbi:unnamed protein product [Microthlaspi erraticum]|uniref:SHSP domain-containing protein n=1 Tax=Microthlaspi erraticum TaxID=1685480 RepID=A0A6D2INF5_9BRAS|nr:unnamed protein product [Microthlaspi erraticum]